MLELRDRIATLVDASTAPVSIDHVRVVVRRRRIRWCALAIACILVAIAGSSYALRDTGHTTTRDGIPALRSTGFGILEIPTLHLRLDVSLAIDRESLQSGP